MRYGLLALVLLLTTGPVARSELRAIPLGIAEQTLLSEVAVVGKVTSLEDEIVKVKDSPTARDKTAYTIAVVKVESVVRGVKNTTHIKVGFVMRGEPTQEQLLNEDAIDRRNENLADGGRYLLHLQKHPSGGFYTFPRNMPPLPITDADKQTEAIAEATFAAGAIADPMKALQAETVRDRTLAAMVLILHYRNPPDTRGMELVPVDATESSAILKAVAEGDWSVPVTGHRDLSHAFDYLGVSGNDGRKELVVDPNENIQIAQQRAFETWLAGPGAKFRIQKYKAKVK
jgi:hypothetical protein